jgi:peptidoglycan/xylan/chitin deacetylase (PgdA/CDA1 family)
MKYLYDPPAIVKKTFGSFTWNTRNNKILFTFDDGPVPAATQKILEKLNCLNIKAVFFCVGDNIKKYPELAGEILKEGHIIGSHTFNHKNVRTLNKEETIKQIRMVNDILQEKFNYIPGYFRPPYGKFKLSTPGILKKEKLKGIMWSLLTYDYKNDFNVVKYSVEKHLRSNSIIVLHDSIRCADIICDSMQYIADLAGKKGLTTGEPSECLK